MDARAPSRRKIEIDLRAAIQNDALQALLSTADRSFYRTITGFEATGALAASDAA